MTKDKRSSFRAIILGGAPGRVSSRPALATAAFTQRHQCAQRRSPCLERRRASLWLSLADLPGGIPPSSQAQILLDRLSTHGALFFDELVDGTRMLRTQVEQVAMGLVNLDSFGGLRACWYPRLNVSRLARRAARPRAVVWDG
jgi:hypothetical protein